LISRRFLHLPDERDVAAARRRNLIHLTVIGREQAAADAVRERDGENNTYARVKLRLTHGLNIIGDKKMIPTPAVHGVECAP
jgi:hypothetical protein